MSAGSTGFAVGAPLGGPDREGPRVDLALTLLKLSYVGFDYEDERVHSLYEESSAHPDVPGEDLDGWGLGAKIKPMEYWNSAKRTENHPACLTRHSSLKLMFGLRGTILHAVELSLQVTPTLQQEPTTLEPVTVKLALAPGTHLHTGTLSFAGTLPDDVGEHELQLEWRILTPGVRFYSAKTPASVETTHHTVFTIYGPPLRPDDHEPTVLDSPKPASREDGTVSGTRKRLSHLMKLISSAPKGKPAAHEVATAEDMEDIWWRIHVGINETTGRPPYFNGAHMAWICPKGPDTKPRLPFTDQWLLWVRTPEGHHWNDASCIGHVQLAKTMLAAIGIPVLRVFILPFTHRLPGGVTQVVTEADVTRPEHRDPEDDRQEATLRFGERSFTAHVVLMERDGAKAGWEEYEAAIRTKAGRLLPGGYTPSNMPKLFREQHGFNSAMQLLHWWTRTKRGSFERFMCWAFHNPQKGELRYWDVDGDHYEGRDFQKIFDRGKALPPPPLSPPPPPPPPPPGG